MSWNHKLRFDGGNALLVEFNSGEREKYDDLVHVTSIEIDGSSADDLIADSARPSTFRSPSCLSAVPGTTPSPALRAAHPGPSRPRGIAEASAT